jgi:pimeloyl-ACP methyl ester carboxylesterase
MSLTHRILRKPFFGRFEVPWQFPAGVDPAGWERVSFRNPRGGRLAGLIGEAEAEPVGALVLAHPMGKAAKGFWLRFGYTDLFRKAGFHVLAFDLNGFGESEPVSFDYPADVAAAGRFLQERYPSLPVGLVGISLGAGWGLCSLAREESPYRAAVLEGAFPTLPDFWRRYPIAYAALRASQLVWPRLEHNLRPVADAARIRNHPDVLLIYGDADEFTPPAQGERLFRAMQGVANAEMWVLPGVGHTFAFRDRRDEYAERVVSFLLRSLTREAAMVMSGGAAAT